MFNIHLWHLPSTKPTRWSSRTNMLAVCGRQRSPLMNWMAFEQREWVSVGDIKISRTWKNNLISSAGFELPKCCFLESGIKMKICSVMPCNMLTFTFLEKHVSLNYNPCWYQNVCSLNIYKPRVTSKAEHRHLETSFFFFSPPPSNCCVPKEMQWKHYRLSCKRVNSSERATHSSSTSNGSEKEKVSATQQTAQLKNQSRSSVRDERAAFTAVNALQWQGKSCKYWHCDSPRHTRPPSS